MPLPALDHVNVVVSDMDRSAAFYGALLGLSPLMDRILDEEWFAQVTGIPGARARCVILGGAHGGCRIELLQFLPAGEPPLSRLPSAAGLRHAAIRVADLNGCLAAYAQLTGMSVRPVEVPSHIIRGGKRMCYVEDPDGAILELCQYGMEQPEFA